MHTHTVGGFHIRAASILAALLVGSIFTSQLTAQINLIVSDPQIGPNGESIITYTIANDTKEPMRISILSFHVVGEDGKPKPPDQTPGVPPGWQLRDDPFRPDSLVIAGDASTTYAFNFVFNTAPQDWIKVKYKFDYKNDNGVEVVRDFDKIFHGDGVPIDGDFLLFPGTPIPEPGTYGLAGAAALLLFAIRKRLRRVNT